MVTQKILDDYDFENIEDYFDYIMTSKINGQHKQARELFKQLTKDDGMKFPGQRTRFFDYISTTYFYEAQDNGNEIAEEIENLKIYFKNL